MNKNRSSYIIYGIIILVVCFYGFLTGCKGSAGSDNPVGVYYNGASTTPQTIDVNITQDGRVIKTSAPSGRMTLEALEDNTYNSNVVLKITENPSMGNESSFLTVGSIVYSITATRDGLPVNLLSHPLTLTLSNEEKLDGAENYYIGIKDINGGDWQFVNLYSSNPSIRTSLGSRNQFSYSLYKNNILVALFSDIGKSLRSTPKVLGIAASLSPTALAAEHSKYNEDLNVNILLAGENLSGLKAEDFKIKIAYLNSDSQDTTLKVDDKTVSYLSGSGSNKYEGFGLGYAHYFQFVPLSSKYSAGYSPTISFDINLKNTLVYGFPNSFIVEISNSNSTILPFGYSAILNFTVDTSGTNTETNTNTDTDTETETQTQTDTNTNTNTDSATDTGTGTNTDPAPKPTLKLNSPTTDFPVTNSTIELEFSDDVPWIQADISKITIDNNAEISGCSYNNKILSLSLKNRLNYETTYNISVSNLAYAENNTFTITTEGKATVSLKSESRAFPVKDNPIELEFSKEIPWTVQDAEHITIDNGVNITSYLYNNKVLSLGFSGKLNYSKTYKVSVADFEAVVNNDNLTFTTESLNVTPVISSASQNVAPNTDGKLTILQPKFFVDFGKEISNSDLAISSIKFNDEALPQSCNVTFDTASKTATIQFTENLNEYTEYQLSVVGFTDDDGAAINSTASALNFKTIFPENITGSGTEDDPFQIYSENHLKKLNETSPINYLGNSYYFKQMENIALKEFWIPIGKNGSPFIGHYDGNNKEISNININQPTKDYLGLFGRINNSSLSNIIIKNVNISGQYNTGSLVGYSVNSVINNIKAKDNITVNGTEDCGGLIGGMNNSDISNASIEGTIKISVALDSGALSGYIYNTSEHSITNCSVIGDNTSFVTGENAGGLIGYILGNQNLSKCYSKISVTGTNNLGGLIGYYNSTSSIISNSYSDSSITANSSVSKVGGLVGEFKGTLTNSYASGSIFLNCEKASYVGVTIGFLDNTSTVSNTFSSVGISVADGYAPTSSDHYAPSDVNIPLWWLKNSNYIFNTSGTNYVSEGYKESLNWDSDVWDNLTEGALPTLK